MASTATRQTTSRPSNGSAKGGSATLKTTAKQAGAKPASPRRRTASSRLPDVPPWAATVASIVGVGVAVGVGLFATRNQWLPKAEEWGEQIASKFRHENDEEFYGDAIADDDEDSWDEGDRVSRAAFPDRDLYPAAQAVS